MIKQISCLGLMTTMLVLTNSNISHAVTFNLSGFSITDGTDTYTAEGSFDWDGGAGSSFSNSDPQIQNTFTIEVSGPDDYSFIFDSSNIDFSLSTIMGMVNDDNTLASFTTIDLLDDSFNNSLSDDGINQHYFVFDSGILLTTFEEDVMGTPFNDATTTMPTVVEPNNILGLLVPVFFLIYRRNRPKKTGAVKSSW